MSLTKEEVDKRIKTGKFIISDKDCKIRTNKDEKKVIFYFGDSIKRNHPRLLKKNNLPCCFGKEKKESKDENKSENESNTMEIDNRYIKDSGKMPLNNGAYGFIPLSIQKLFHTYSQDYFTDKTNKRIKKNQKCLFRIGVENSETQSFLSCIAQIISKDNKILSLNDVKQLLINGITIDVFITAMNGDLIDIFYNDKENNEYNGDVSQSKIIGMINNYNSKYINEMIKQKKKILNSYNNFLNYLKDDNSIIDYKYLWDIISKPNPLFFDGNGIDLIILNIN